MPAPAPASDRRCCFVRLDLTEEEHRALRLAAAYDGRSMASFARVAVAEAARVVLRNAPGVPLRPDDQSAD